MQELGQVDGVLSFWELSQALVSRLAERLGLPANPPAAVDAAREKQVRGRVGQWAGVASALEVTCVAEYHAFMDMQSPADSLDQRTCWPVQEACGIPI